MRRCLANLLLAGLTAGTSPAAEFAPAPQPFQQEVATHFTSADGLPSSEVQLIELDHHGQPRAFVGGRWYVKQGRWLPMGQTTPPRHDIPDTEFTFDHAFGVRVTVSVPWREVRQVLRAPAELGFWLVSTGEFTDLPSLASRLSQPSRPVDVWLAGRLSPSATAALANHQGQGSDPGSLPELLAQDLNRVLRSTARADLQHFAGVALSTDTRRVIERARSGDDLVRLFRRLLEDAYPEELARKPALWLATATNLFAVVNDQAHPVGWPSHYRVNQIALRADGVLFVASSHGLFHFRPHQKDWERLAVADGFGRAWAVEDVLGVAFDSRGRLWFASKAGAGCQTQDGWKFYEGEDGLPWNDFTCLAPGPDGAMWFGTRLGAIRFDGREWYYRQGPRWLPHDEVRQVAVEPRGRAWFATAGGAGLIEPWPMTLAQKAAFFEEEIARYIKRTTFGYVAETPLRTAGDKTTAHPEDSDHDGLWTALYGAGECFGYAATKDPATKARAQQAFAALRFLQQVTQESSNAPPRGFVARTIRSTSWPDPNVGCLEADREQQKRDPLWKVYEPRWPVTTNRLWYWKGDTGRDELDGHYFFYPLYFDLCADTDRDKGRVREVVRDLTDHLLTHAFLLIDHDGQPTRWGVFAPQSLNRDPRWWPVRGRHSLSLLSYLAVAAHVTGEARYTAASRELIEDHGYAQNAMDPGVQAGPGSGGPRDDMTAFLCYYSLLRCSRDERLKAQIRASFSRYWVAKAPEMDPFFHFSYVAHLPPANRTQPRGGSPLRRWPDWFEDSLATLRGLPLDRLDWPHRNSHRLDLVPWGIEPSVDPLEARHSGRGSRVNGKVLPVENRHFNHWSADAWCLDASGDGGQLASGTVFLLPYYLGLYHRFIENPRDLGGDRASRGVP